MMESIQPISPDDPILEQVRVDLELQGVLEATDLERKSKDVVLVVDFSRHLSLR